MAEVPGGKRIEKKAYDPHTRCGECIYWVRGECIVKAVLRHRDDYACLQVRIKAE